MPAPNLPPVSILSGTHYQGLSEPKTAEQLSECVQLLSEGKASYKAARQFVRFNVEAEEYDRFQTLLSNDSGLESWVLDNLRYDVGFENDHSVVFTVRIPSYIQSNFAVEFGDAFFDQFLQALTEHKWRVSNTSKSGVSLELNGKKAKISPDYSIKWRITGDFIIIIEVGYSISDNDFLKKAEDYLLSGHGAIKTVIGFNIPYQLPAQQKQNKALAEATYQIFHAEEVHSGVMDMMTFRRTDKKVESGTLEVPLHFLVPYGVKVPDTARVLLCHSGLARILGRTEESNAVRNHSKSSVPEMGPQDVVEVKQIDDDGQPTRCVQSNNAAEFDKVSDLPNHGRENQQENNAPKKRPKHSRQKSCRSQLNVPGKLRAEPEAILLPVRDELRILKATAPESLPAYNPRVRTRRLAEILKIRVLPVGRFITEFLSQAPAEQRGALELKLCHHIASEYWPLVVTESTCLQIQAMYRNAIFKGRSHASTV